MEFQGDYEEIDPATFNLIEEDYHTACQNDIQQLLDADGA